MSTPQDLAGRTIVITGAGGGLGRAWAEGFLREGATVVAVDADPQHLGMLHAAGAITLRADVARPESVERFVATAIERTGRIDVLFNNAGTRFDMPVEELFEGQFERPFHVHLFGAVQAMRLVIPQMRRQGHGRIVNTLCRAAAEATPRNSGYAATKAALWATSRCAAAEVADTDILVNMILPRPSHTGLHVPPRPELAPPEASYATARMLATLPAGGPNGRVFQDEAEVQLFAGL